MRGRSQGSGQGTRDAIVRAAMRGFAEKGFEATSIREIAAMAGTNVASISYHFGGKDGLRAACAEHVVSCSVACWRQRRRAMRRRTIRRRQRGCWRRWCGP